MNKKIIALFAFILLATGSFEIASARAQAQFTEETIVSFRSDITVKPDNSIDVLETLLYDTATIERHGIYRDIYPYSSKGKKMNIRVVSVTDENGDPHIFNVSNSGKNIRIKIGDPEETFSGQRTYVIRYNASRAVSQFKEFDEIYWNVTGSEWLMPIYKSSAYLYLPEGASATQAACYYGPKGSTDTCDVLNSEGDAYMFTAPAPLYPGEELTVAVGFPKGHMEPYNASDSLSGFFYTYWKWIVAGILPFLTLLFSLRHWHNKGRDPKGRGVLVPEYDAPEGLTPIEAAGIVNQKIRMSDISAEIIYLATKGYVKISQTEKSFAGIIKLDDYELTALKSFSDLPNEFDKELLEGLFFADPKTVKLSELKNVFYKRTSGIINSTLDSLFKKGYYKNLGGMKNSAGLIMPLFISVWASLFFGGIVGGFVFSGDALPLIVGIFTSAIIYFTVSRFFPAKTEKGVAAKEHILGLKDYLRIAEKDRLLFHNAPNKRPEVFEKLLPYAMVLGVADIWAKEFEGIYIDIPSWYSGKDGNAFSALALNNSLSSFSSYASSSMSSSPSSSGSGGGGSSGGGGGGGGGGGW